LHFKVQLFQFVFFAWVCPIHFIRIYFRCQLLYFSSLWNVKYSFVAILFYIKASCACPRVYTDISMSLNVVYYLFTNTYYWSTYLYHSFFLTSKLFRQFYIICITGFLQWQSPRVSSISMYILSNEHQSWTARTLEHFPTPTLKSVYILILKAEKLGGFPTLFYGMCITKTIIANNTSTIWSFIIFVPLLYNA